MRYCIFCCSGKLKDAIERATETMHSCVMKWDLDNDCVLCKYHSDISFSQDSYNASIWLENDDIHQLIEDAIYFSVELLKLKTIKQK